MKEASIWQRRSAQPEVKKCEIELDLGSYSIKVKG